MSSRVYGIKTPIRLEYNYIAGRSRSRFLRMLTEKRIIGERCPECHNVYVPPIGACSSCGVPTDEVVEVGQQGKITKFCVVNLPFYGQQSTPPYVCASIQLDGADTTLFHLIQEIPAADVRMGMRVETVWSDEMAPTVESIRYFRPVASNGSDGHA